VINSALLVRDSWMMKIMEMEILAMMMIVNHHPTVKMKKI